MHDARSSSALGLVAAGDHTRPSRKDAGDERGGVQAGGASAIWVNRLLLPKAVVFITVDGASLSGDASSPGADPHRDDGGEA